MPYHSLNISKAQAGKATDNLNQKCFSQIIAMVLFYHFMCRDIFWFIAFHVLNQTLLFGGNKIKIMKICLAISGSFGLPGFCCE